MIVLGVDPGHEHSAWVTYDSDDRCVVAHGDENNSEILRLILESAFVRVDVLAIEMIGAMGMRVGAEIFHTCRWIGKFEQAWRGRCDLIGRPTIKGHLCGSAKADDSDVRACLIERWGGKAAIKKGGPLAGIVTHRWQALAVAVAWAELRGKQHELGDAA